jgi:hypothetical protein
MHRPSERIEEAAGDSYDSADHVSEGNGDKPGGGAIDEQRRPGAKLEANFRRKADGDNSGAAQFQPVLIRGGLADDACCQQGKERGIDAR